MLWGPQIIFLSGQTTCSEAAAKPKKAAKAKAKAKSNPGSVAETKAKGLGELKSEMCAMASKYIWALCGFFPVFSQLHAVSPQPTVRQFSQEGDERNQQSERWAAPVKPSPGNVGAVQEKIWRSDWWDSCTIFDSFFWIEHLDWTFFGLNILNICLDFNRDLAKLRMKTLHTEANVMDLKAELDDEAGPI